MSCLCFTLSFFFLVFQKVLVVALFDLNSVDDKVEGGGRGVVLTFLLSKKPFFFLYFFNENLGGKQF